MGSDLARRAPKRSIIQGDWAGAPFAEEAGMRARRSFIAGSATFAFASALVVACGGSDG